MSVLRSRQSLRTLCLMLTIALALVQISRLQGQEMLGDPGELPETVVEAEDPGDNIIDVAPDDAFADFDPEGYGEFGVWSQNYPSLADIDIGGLNGGGLRGPPTSLFDTPQAIDVLTQEYLTERSPIDMGMALEQTVGVMVQRTGRGQSSPYVRGLTGQQVLVMVDGVRFTNATYRAGPNQYFNTIDPNMVERIEVIRGSGAVLYGADAIGGVINVVTKSSKISGFDYATGSTVQRFSSADLGYTGRVNVEGSVGSMGVFAGGGYGNYNNLDIGGGAYFPAGVSGRQQSTSWGYNSGDIKLNYALSDSSQLIYSYQHYMGEDVYRSDRNPANRWEIFDPQQREMTYLRWQGETDGLVSTYQITGSYYLTKERRTDQSGVNPPSRFGFDDTQVGVTAAFGTNMYELGWLTYGFDWYRDTVSDSTNQYPNDADYNRYAPYINWDVWVTENVLFSAGGRYEKITTGATPFPTPLNPAPVFTELDYDGLIGQGGVTVKLTEDLHWIANINQAFRAPNLDDLFAINTSVFGNNAQFGNTNLVPERSITYETGFKLNQEQWRSEIYAFWTVIDDYIVRVNAGLPPPNQNALIYVNSSAFLQGFEYNGEFLFTPNWSVYGNCWYVYGQDTGFNEPMSKIPPLQGVVGFRWREEGNWFDIYTWLVDDQNRLSTADRGDNRRIPPGGTPGYGTINLRAGHMISDRQRISLVGENLTDKFYRVHGSGSAGAGIGCILSYEILR